MPKTVNVLLADYGQFGWGLSSPQLPGFIGGRSTMQEAQQDLGELLTFAGMDPSDEVEIHLEKYVALQNDDEIVVRLSTATNYEDRQLVSRTLVGALTVASQVSKMLNVPRRPTGEVLFVCAVPSDTIGWIMGQLEDDDAACVVIQEAPNAIRTQTFGSGSAAAVMYQDQDSHRVSDMGWNENTTLQEILDAQTAGKIEGKQLVSA